MLYCKLYIDSDEKNSDLQRVIDVNITELYGDLVVDAPVFDNENYTGTTNHHDQFYAIERSRFYVEIDADSKPDSRADEFQIGTARLVKRLREEGRFVVASCEFEELIVSETGWNWTAETPLPPA